MAHGESQNALKMGHYGTKTSEILCNIDMAGVCALQVLVNHFAVDVHTTISCDAFDSPHLYSDDD